MDDDLDYNQREVIRKVADAAFSDITGSIIDTHSAVVVLAITLTLEISGIGLFFIAKEKVGTALDGSDGGVWAYISMGVFVVGFLNAFAIYRLIANKWPHRGSSVNTWLISIAAGLVNLLLFFILTRSIAH